MADKRTIKFEIAVDADTKGVDRFNKVLRDLENAAPIAESELRKVRQGILEFSQQSGTSATSLKALEAALTKLQSEARGGSALWKTLGGDIAGVRQQIGELTGTIRSAEQAQKDLNRALNAPVGNTFGKLAEQTGKLKNELRDLNYRSQEYIRTLTRVKELETVGSFQQGRLNTIAANQAFMGSTLARGYGASANLPSLPDTLAGDAQRVSELSERIRNLDRGSELYLQTVKELAAANDQLARSQREYNRELAGTAEIERRRTVEGAAQSRLSLADRAAELRRERQQFERDAAQRARGEALLLSQADGRSTISSGRDALSLSAAAAEQRRRRQEFEREARARAAEDFIATSQASGRRTIESGRDTLALSARAAELRQQRQQREQEAAQRARGIGDAGFGQFGPETPQDFQRRVAPSVAAIGAANEALTTARQNATRRAAEQAAKQAAFLNEVEDRLAQQQLAAQKRHDQELIDDFDRRLDNRVKRREQRRRKLREAGEVATAVGVAGYFGGPEAVAGAAVGAMFGPGGAQVGTTLGLAAGGLRQQVAGFSDQAAQLNKLRISLKEIAGSESEYTRAINTITRANREFNIPLLEGTRAMTQLTAAVKGAGGTVADAELAYRGITAAIKATGGSSADAEGAIRALVQTFSKGKVSAEEIRQQLAERLPGAVTLFAQATGRTGAELDKAFEKGEVGLNDLMKFLATLNTRYSETARRLAASNDEAGLRLQLRWEQTTLAIGEAFKPLGAEIQNSLITILKENSASIIEFTRGTTTAIKGISDNREAIGFLVTLTAQFGAAKIAILALSSLQPRLAAFFASVSTGAVTASGQIKALGLATATLARAVAKPIVVTLVIAGATQVYSWLTKVKEAQDAIKKAQSGLKGESWVASIGGSAAATDEVTRQVSEAGKAYQVAADNIKTYRKELEWQRLKPRREFLEQQIRAQEAKRDLAASRYRAGIDELARRTGETAKSPTIFQDPTGQDDKTLAAIKKRDEDLFDARQRREQRIADIRKQATEQIIELEKKFAEDRLNSEREIQRIRRQIQASQEETSRILRLQAGEDPAIIEVERQISKISRDAVEAKIEAEQSIKDKEREQAKLINDLQKQTANQINKENESYSRRIGEIQKDYARKTGKIIEDSTIKSAQRIESAAKSLSEALKQNFAELENSLKRERQAWNIVRQLQGVRPIPEPSGYSRDGRPVYGMPSDGVPDMFRNIDQKLYRFNKRQSSSSIGSPSRSTIGDQFISLLGTQGGYEDIAGLQPLPIQRMQRQAARPLQAIWKMMGYGTIDQYMPDWAQKKNRPALHKKVLERIQRMDEVRRNWNPLDAEWKERTNRNNPAPRSKPATGGIDTFYQIQKTLEKSVINRLIPTGVPLRGDLSDYLTPNELRVLRSSLKDLGKERGSYVDGSNTFGKAVNSIKQEYGMRVWKRWERSDSGSNPLESIGDDVEWLRQYLERTDPPLIKPGVGSQFEGASLPGGIGNQFLSMISKSGGYGQVATAGNSVYRLPVNAFPAAGEATRGRQQELRERNTSIDLNATNETLSVFQRITEQSEATRRNLINQVKQQQIQADLIRRGINPAIADQLASLDMAYEAEMKLLDAARAKAISEGIYTKESEEAYANAVDRAQVLLGQNKELTKELNRQRDAILIFKEEFNQLTDLQSVAYSLGKSIETSVSGAIGTSVTNIATGSVSIKQTLGEMFASIGRSFVDMAAQIIAKQLVMASLNTVLSIFGGGGTSGGGLNIADMNKYSSTGPISAGMFKASGGPVTANKTYVVGEKGPELFVPSMPGVVIPNPRTEAILQARAALAKQEKQRPQDARFQENYQELSKAQAFSRERKVEELVTTGASSMEIKYSRVGSGDLPFVTEEDMLQAARIAAQEGARMGQQRTLAALKNNPASRRAIGI